ncbi:hypothetical protein PG993_011520 [Apiospora rasikravindrae]|uniref:Uncharacterized protein n=1 Tax=Apiospora rasikravindrae TaxID=990691 RepID=A0ABR1SEG9_9PEZI
MGETVPDVYTPWLKDGVPEEISAEFQSLLTLTSRTSFEPKGFSWKDAPNPETWCAFGDRGTTALVGAYGDIIQFGTYTGRGHSGLFTADRSGLDEPYWVVDRTRQLQDWAEGNGDFEKHYGLQVYEAPSSSLEEQKRLVPPPSFQSYSGVHLRFRIPLGKNVMEIRDLDHVTTPYVFNSSHLMYTEGFGPNRYSWILTHDLEPQKPDMKDNKNGDTKPGSRHESIAVIASVMQDGNLVRWAASSQASPEDSQPNPSTVDIPERNWEITLGADKRSSTEVVIAYKMVLLPRDQSYPWTSFIIPADAMDVNRILSKEPQFPHSLHLSTKDHGSDQHGVTFHKKPPNKLPDTPQAAVEHIEFVPRRIENKSQNTSTAEDNKSQQPDDRVAPVALTCGDFSFHRVSASASFFAFAFLVEIQRRLQTASITEDPYVQELLRRIKSVCDGHIQWLSTRVSSVADKGCLANYWVSGDPIKDKDTNSWLAEDSPLDAAFQIIKVDYYAQLGPEQDATARNALPGISVAWLTALGAKEHRKSFTWPHAARDDFNVFRLDDHIWIWRAIKATNEWDLSSWIKESAPANRPADGFSHREVQREVLRRFTTNNDDISGERMLALTRSCRETRFLLHARDTVLFHSIDWGFPLQEPPFHKLWANTIESQSHHDENQEDQWDNTLRYALAVMMGCRGYSINKRAPQELLRGSLTTLLGSSSLNGLFAGQLNASTKQPICFLREEDRDFHFHCTFEIPYILLVNSSRISDTPSEDTQKRQNIEPVLNITPVRGYTETPDFEAKAVLATLQGNPLISHNHQLAAALAGTLGRPLRKPAVFKKRQPFSYLIDSTNIVEIEEEWLYNFPAFLVETSKASASDTISTMMIYLLEGVDLREALEAVLVSQPQITANIVHFNEDLQKELCESITDYAQERRRILALIILGICRSGHFTHLPSFNRRFTALKKVIDPILLEFEKKDELKPEDVKAIHAIQTPATEAFTAALRAQSSSKSEHWWRFLRTQSGSTPEPVPSVPQKGIITYNDPGIPILADLLGYYELRERLSVIMRDNVDFFVSVASGIPAFQTRIAAILDDDAAMLARVILGNSSLYEKLQESISKKVTTGSWVRQEIQRYMENLISAHAATPTQMPPAHIYMQQHALSQPNEETAPMPPKMPEDVILDEHCGAFVVDTTKKVSQGRGQKAEGYDSKDISGTKLTNKDLWHEVLNIPRTPEGAKKRFIWLPDANMTTALVCFLGSPQVERDPMNLFFDRHLNYELFFFDDTTPHLNTWETEFHISFYQIIYPGRKQQVGMPKPFRQSFPGKRMCDLTKASMGFRFFGDFFDRYWTCHFIEYIPSDGPDKVWDLPFDRSSSRSTKNREWRQRKVLELYLFERIVVKVVNSTREIYDMAREELRMGGEAFSMGALNSGAYFSSSEHWQKCQETLQVVEDRLEHIATEIAKWDSRERDRGLERPRWTRNDERKYSGEIKKRLGSSNSKVRDLRRLQADITVLKNLLISRQDQIRNDLSLRSAENIRFFTYVTVVFLPLGFASSVFSMSEVPNPSLVGSMVIVAAVALILTGFALTTNGISRRLPGLSEKAMNHSRLANSNRDRDDQSAGVDNYDANIAAAQMERQTTTWYLRFWLTYLLVEKPIRRVALAYDAMKQPKWTLMTGVRIVLALFVLPYCLCVWLVRVLAYNAVDLTKLLWHKFKFHLPASPGTSANVFQGVMGSLLNPDRDSMRPFKAKEAQKKDKKMPQTRVPSEQPKLNEIEGGEAPTEA